MDVLIEWQSGGKNVVARKDLVCTYGPKITIGATVKMYWKPEGIWYLGTVIDIEQTSSSDDSEDNVPLIKLLKDGDPYNNNNQHCEAQGCSAEVFSACPYCMALLCWTHFDNLAPCQNRHAVVSHNTQNIVSMDIDEENAYPNPESFEMDGCPREEEHVVGRTVKTNKRALAKQTKNKGGKYVSTFTKQCVQEKVLKPQCNKQCDKFRKECSKITDIERETIFKDFYKTGDLQLQREYINRYVRINKTKVKTIKSREWRRSNTYSYYFPKAQTEIPVCKLMFLNTLSVSEKVVRTALAKRKISGVIEKEKRRRRQQSQIERDNKIRTLITQHINRFPRVESHYYRSDSTREYLHPNLTTRKMYRMLMQEQNDLLQPMPTYELYRQMFKSINLSFHHPIKDRCGLCRHYLEGDEAKKTVLEEKFQKHVAEKEAVRNKKKKLRKQLLMVVAKQ